VLAGHDGVVDERMATRVLHAVELVPPGHVVTYGDLAELVGGSARQVGAVMRLRGGEVPWWRVVNASGELPPHLHDEVLPLWLEEGITWSRAGRCRIDLHRCDLVRLADDYETATPPGP
jgi:methylated-DNA-protein-cysteine methyltransferase-like protein